MAEAARRVPIPAAQRAGNGPRSCLPRARLLCHRGDRSLFDRRRDRGVRPRRAARRQARVPRVPGALPLSEGSLSRVGGGAAQAGRKDRRARDDRDECAGAPQGRSGHPDRRGFRRAYVRHLGGRAGGDCGFASEADRRADVGASATGRHLAPRGNRGRDSPRHPCRQETAGRASGHRLRLAGPDDSLARPARIHDPAPRDRGEAGDRGALPLQPAADGPEHGGGTARHLPRPSRQRHRAGTSPLRAAAAGRATLGVSLDTGGRANERGHRHRHGDARSAHRSGRVRAADPHGHPTRRYGAHSRGCRPGGRSRAPRAGNFRRHRPRGDSAGAEAMIRRADERDVPEIARIINAAFEVEREFREGARTSPTEIAKLLEHDVFFVAEEDGRLLGAVHTSIDGATGYFGMLSVDPALQRGGVGRALLAAAEEHCRKAGCTKMTMSTGEDRAELIPYYERVGYRVTSIEPSSSRAFKRPIRIVKMAKDL
ncbi:MAG: GNAT family N-acetyltransferase [Deltaproteobacteria bacterium]|nr:MAG: GNAT family N-acetyltransferase [Deltaproteobacteria bacterium]